MLSKGVRRGFDNFPSWLVQSHISKKPFYQGSFGQELFFTNHFYCMQNAFLDKFASFLMNEIAGLLLSSSDGDHDHDGDHSHHDDSLITKVAHTAVAFSRAVELVDLLDVEPVTELIIKFFNL